jgi:hypothetical protein
MTAVRLVLALLIGLGLSGGAFAATGESHGRTALEHCGSNASDRTCDSMPGKAPATKACLGMTGCANGVSALPSLPASTKATVYAKPIEAPEEPHPSGRAVAPDIPIPLV